MANLLACPYVPLKGTGDYDGLMANVGEYVHDNMFILKNALQAFKNKNGYEDEWFPDNEQKLARFEGYLRQTRRKERVQENESIKEDSLVNLYSTMYNLYHNPQTLENRINMIANDFREQLDILQKKDTENYSRQELLVRLNNDEESGFQVVVNKVFDHYRNFWTNKDKIMSKWKEVNPNATEEETRAEEEEVDYIVEQYEKIIENKDRLTALAATKIGESEGFVVNLGNAFKVSFDEFRENEDIEEPEEGDSEDDGQDKSEKSKGDRYVDFRTLKLMESLSPAAKRLISRIPMVDNDGYTMTDDLGSAKYLEPRQVAVVLKRALVHSSPASMMADINLASEFYPWMKSLYDYLYQNKDKQAIIYSAFKGAETSYYYTEFSNGYYTVHDANTSASGNALAQDAGVNVQSGFVVQDNTSVYTSYGHLKSKEDISNLVKKYHEDTDKLLEELAKISTTKGDSNFDMGRMDSFLKAYPNVPQMLAEWVRGCGFLITADDIRTVAMQEMSQKSLGFIEKGNPVGHNKLYHIIKATSEILGRAQEIYKKGETSTGQYLFNTCGTGYRKMNRCLALAKYNEREERVLMDGKSLSTYNPTNLIHQVTDLLSNATGQNAEKYRQDLDENFLQYEGYALGFGEKRKLTGWLKYLYDGAGQLKLQLVNCGAFNHVEYDKLSRQQKMANSLLMYKKGFFEVPIQSDYSTAYDFIAGPSYSYDQIIDNLVEEVQIEIERMDSIQERQKDSNRDELKTYEEQGLRFQVFPEFNDNGILSRYKAETDDAAAEKILRDAVADALRDRVARDMRSLDNAEVLKNENMRNSLGVKSSDGTVAGLDDDSRAMLEQAMREMFYARLQMLKLFDGGLQNFQSLVDFEKRAMITHATHSSLYTEATINGDRVLPENRNGNQHIAYINDDIQKSAFYDQIMAQLKALKEQKLIDDITYKEVAKAYSEITSTDGHGFRSVNSFRAVMAMSGQWTDKLESAYQNIKNKKATKKDIQTFFQMLKLVTTGFEHIPAANGQRQKPVKLTVLHKYAESVCVSSFLAKYCLEANSAPMAAMSDAFEENDVDLFLFASGCKVGQHANLNMMKKDENKQRVLSTRKQMADYLNDALKNDKYAIHKIPYMYTGVAAATPVHAADDEIARSSQVEKACWGNIDPNDTEALERRDNYYKLKTAKIVKQYQELRDLFNNPKELSRILNEELSTKSYNSRELRFALHRISDDATALPLFVPNVVNQVEQLLASIIKKRLTRIKSKGVNLLVSPPIGMEQDIAAYSAEGAINHIWKLGVKFDNSGKFQYYEAGLPIFDSRLLRFADENGNIGPDRLQQLVDDGIIDENILYFNASRTPSDAEHSALACKVKWFSSNISGASIRIAKEAMVTTGEDTDGDKLRCDFVDFDIVTETDKDSKAYGKKVVKAYQYDYSSDPLTQNVKAIDNAMVQLMHDQLSSENCSRRALIPGGCEKSKIFAKSIYLTRASSDKNVKAAIKKALGEIKNEDEVSSAMANAVSLYDTLRTLTNSQLKKVMNAVSGIETPYTFTHAADAYDYIMGGANMIGTYAIYNTAYTMLQRANGIKYIPKKTQSGKDYIVDLFGIKFGESNLFPISNNSKDEKSKELGSLTLARLLNAAVDNGKDPILGYLNQSEELAKLTFLLVAQGFSEEQIHLLMNQPVIIELASRMKGVKDASLPSFAQELIDEILANMASDNDLQKLADVEFGEYAGVSNSSYISESALKSNIPVTYSDVVNTTDFDLKKQQMSLLQIFKHLSGPASDLDAFVKLTRPESNAGAIGATIPETVTRLSKLDEFRDRIGNPDNPIRFSGMSNIIRSRNIFEGMDSSAIMDEIGTELSEVVALNSLEKDASLDMYRPYFPYVKDSWIDLAKTIAKKYQYKTLQPGVMKKIFNEMVLWKLLSDKQFVAGNSKDEQFDILINCPKRLSDLMDRINKVAVDDTIDDPAAKALVGNAFLTKLRLTSPENSRSAPKIMFTMNGPAIEGTADLIRNSWNQLLSSKEEGIRQLGYDMFKYNMYTNGFQYGMYEFAHFAPFSVVMRTPGYVDALRRILSKSEFLDADDNKNFVHQFIMNHWGDKKFLLRYAVPGEWIDKVGSDEDINLTNDGTNAAEYAAFINEDYVILEKGKGKNKYQDLRRVLVGGDGVMTLQQAEKAGIKLRGNQTILTYDPSVNYTELKPVFAGNASAWGYLDVDEDNALKQANYTDSREKDYAGRAREASNSEALDAAAKMFGARIGGITHKKREELNKNIRTAIAKTGNTQQEQSSMQEEQSELPAGVMNLFGAPVKKEYYLVERDDNGDIIINGYPASVNTVERARAQKVYAELDDRLREFCREHNINVGVITEAEARLDAGGVTEFHEPEVLGEIIKADIRLAHGEPGLYALPEECSHVALRMLGIENPLVQRLLTALDGNDAYLNEAFDGQLDKYKSIYGDERPALLEEAAGKLVAKELLYRQQIESSPIRKLIHRICEAIKDFFRQFKTKEIDDAVAEAKRAAQTVASGIFEGNLLDQIHKYSKLSERSVLYNVKKDISEKETVLSKLLETERKRLQVLQTRVAHANKEDSEGGVLAHTSEEISKLQKAIEDNLGEAAVVDYLQGATTFMDNTMQSLRETITQRSSQINSVCSKLNVVRDTLFSFAKVLEDIREAISDGEITDTTNISPVLDKVSGTVQNYFQEYRAYSMTYLEKMLSGIYGPEGVEVKIGRDKGRKISIKEMARKADGDIGFAKRFLYSVADCPDYILKAMDELVRKAKFTARRDTDEVRVEVENAVNKLVAATGSRDQSFMFKWVVDKYGNEHKVYIDKQDAQKLSPAKYEFYQTMMKYIDAASKLLPPDTREPEKIIMVRKDWIGKVIGADSAKGCLDEAWDSMKNLIMDTGDIDYDTELVSVDFEGNKVDSLPIKFVNKSPEEKYDDMTEDVALSVMVFTGMANEYYELNKVAATIENAKYMSSQRDVAQKTGFRKKVEAIGNLNTDVSAYTKDFTIKQARTNIQALMEDFIQMQLYGHIQKAEGTIGHTRISKRKAANAVSNFTSMSQMALNLPQRIANVTTGMTQIIIESVGKGIFNVKDMMKARAIWVKERADSIKDIGKTDYDNKLSLFRDKFDVSQDNGRTGKSTHYGRGRTSRIFNSHMLYAGLTIGEDYLSSVTALACAFNYKVKNAEGKEANLWDAYEVRYKDAANKSGAYLAIKDGYTNADGSPITFNDEFEFSKKVAGLNFEMQGIYNVDDRSAVQQYWFGALMIMYRKWIAPALKRRYGQTQLSTLKNDWEEGYYRTIFNFLKDSGKDTKEKITEAESEGVVMNMIDDIKAFMSSVSFNWDHLTAYEKSNVRKACTEMAIVLSLFASTFLLAKLPPDDENGKSRKMTWGEMTLYSQLLRLRTEIGSQAPTPMLVDEAMKIVKSPFAALGPLRDSLNLFRIMMPQNWVTKVKSGRYKGRSKAYKYFRNLPVISMFKKLDNFADPTDMIHYYETGFGN